MNIWMISREYAEIAEAGGVKNVVCSLSEELCNLNNQVTLFIPEYGCTNFSKIKNYKELDDTTFSIQVADRFFDVKFATGFINSVKIIFIKNIIYSEKNNIYTYCKKDLEQQNNFNKIIGTGYEDWLFLDILFQKSICVFAKSYCLQQSNLNNFQLPDIVHCHDACVATLPALAKIFYNDIFEKTKFIVTIHNAGPAYHHEFSDINQAFFFTNIPYEILQTALNNNRVEPYLLACNYSKISTVSYDYATELLEPNNQNTDGLSQIFFDKKIKITGITNGIDINKYSPENKQISLLPYEYSPMNLLLDGKYNCRKYFISNFAKKDNFVININNEKIIQAGFLESDDDNKNIYISFHGRLVRQKGILIILDLFEKLFQKYDNVKFIINGQGENFLQDELIKKANQFPGKILYLCGYEKSLARLCTAVGDFALFPSEFEPCGLEDFIAQIYATIPIAHATGGLKKIIDSKTGFTYFPNTTDKLFEVVTKIIDKKIDDFHCYDSLIKEAACYLKENFTWQHVTQQKYLQLYQS